MKKKISVVTVTYNAAHLLKATIESVISQTYKNIEYIIIDGDSTDNTDCLLRQYNEKIAYWISETDNGIYDAMNKAIEISSGEWIIFINSGDYFATNDVIEKIFISEIQSDVDFIYGDYIKSHNGKYTVVRARPLSLMWQRISFSHQSLFSRTSLMKERPFNTKYRVVSDYENYFKRYMEGRKFQRVSFPISIFLTGGYSEINFTRRTYERWRIIRKYHPKQFERNTFYMKLIINHIYEHQRLQFYNSLRYFRRIIRNIFRYLKRVLIFWYRPMNRIVFRSSIFLSRIISYGVRLIKRNGNR